MKRIGGICLTIGLMVGVLVIGAPDPAGAITTGGGCGFTTVSGGVDTDDVPTYRGVVYLRYRTEVGQTVTISCEFFAGGVSQGIVLGPTTGTGVVADAGPLEYELPEGQGARICAHIVLDGVPQPDNCGDAEPFDPIQYVLDIVFGALEDAEKAIDPTLCAVLATAAPAVNALGEPTLIRIDPTYGDVYLFDELFWDCPPYTIV